MASSNFYYLGLSAPLASQATVHTRPNRAGLGTRSDSRCSSGNGAEGCLIVWELSVFVCTMYGCSTMMPSVVIHIFIGGYICASVIDQDVRAETSRRLFLLKKSKTNGEDDGRGALIQRSS